MLRDVVTMRRAHSKVEHRHTKSRTISQNVWDVIAKLVRVIDASRIVDVDGVAITTGGRMCATCTARVRRLKPPDGDNTAEATRPSATDTVMDDDVTPTSSANDADMTDVVASRIDESSAVTIASPLSLVIANSPALHADAESSFADNVTIRFGGGGVVSPAPSSSSPVAARSADLAVMSNWATLIGDIGTSHGQTAKFTRVAGAAPHTQHRVKSNTPAERVSVRKFVRDWSANAQLVHAKHAETKYMVDVDVSPTMQAAIIRDHPMMRAYGPFGRNCMHQYLPLAFRSARGDDRRLIFAGLRFFISPPLHRRHSTSAHTDGYGYFVTVHWVLPCSNANTQNRVQTWDRAQAGLPADTSQLYAFSVELQHAIDIDERGGSSDKTRSQWSCDITESTAPVDAESHRRLEAAHLSVGTTVAVGRDECYVMSPGLLHVFQKELREPGDTVPAATSGAACVSRQRDGEGDMMIGVAGNDVLIGKNEDEATANLAIYMAHASAMRVVARTMPIDIPLWLGILCAGAWPSSLVITDTHRAHFRAARPHIVKMLAADGDAHKQILEKVISVKVIKVGAMPHIYQAKLQVRAR